MLNDMREQLASTKRTLTGEEERRAKNSIRIKDLEGRLKREHIDVKYFVHKSRDVFKKKWEKDRLKYALYGALEWANRDFRKEFAKLKELESEYDTHCVNIDILRGNIKTIEENIDVIKKRIREFDNEEKKDDERWNSQDQSIQIGG
ncbi:hypothetical protein [Ruminococcus sp.]|uniref:hypothetical protein n=1 Tax=Ruminococcus sp. TaxID=41978 RepID=UPI003EFC290B